MSNGHSQAISGLARRHPVFMRVVFVLTSSLLVVRVSQDKARDPNAKVKRPAWVQPRMHIGTKARDAAPPTGEEEKTPDEGDCCAWVFV